MKISLNWIKDYVSIGITLDSLVHKLTMAGLEVEKISEVGGDTVLELEITPNRADCLNMVGMAREIGAVLNKNYDFPSIKKIKFPTQKCDIKNEEKKYCLRYVGTLIEGVNIAESPQWIRKRLASLETRSINNVVDITNFCLHELGQPLHAFDYDKLEGGKIIVRKAQKGEKITTLDGIERELDPSILIIADEKRPVAIAGIMGGKDTEVGPETKNILLESAYFDPILIRRAVRKLKLSSDSAYRFERGVDFNMVEQGSRRAIALILQSASGKIVRYTDNVVKKAKFAQSIEITLDKINAYLGASLEIRKCINILKKLEFSVTQGRKGSLKATPPNFRTDIKEEVDLIEEIARVIGYDNLPSSLPTIKAINIQPNPKKKVRSKLKQLLCAEGVSEVITYSMYSREWLEKTKQVDLKSVFLKNPLTREQEIMRPSLLPSLLAVVHTNINRGLHDLKFFEVGKIYSAKEEKETLGLVFTGIALDDWRKAKKDVLGFYDIKGIIEHFFVRMDIRNIHFESKASGFMEEGQAAGIFRGNKNVGIVGKVAQEVLDNWSIKQKDVFFAQIDLEFVYKEAISTTCFTPISEFPSIVRDISLAVHEDVSFQKIQDLAFSLGNKILKSVTFTEQYLGDKIEKGSRGLVFSLKYQSSDKTLREDEVNAVHERIEKALVEDLGAVRR